VAAEEPVIGRTRRLVPAAAVAALALALAGCGADGASVAVPRGSVPVKFQLNWMGGGVNAGFEVALQKGYYADEGLDVTIVQGNGSANTAQLVAAGNADIAYADAAAVMSLVAKGAKMQVLSTVYQSSPSEVTALTSSGIRSMSGLRGRRVGVPSGGSQNAILPLLLKANGLTEHDVDLVDLPATSMVPALLRHQVDAILGSTDAYAIQIARQHVKTVNFLFATHGAPNISTSVFANSRYAAAHQETVRKFVAASLRGWSTALDDPDEAVKDVQKTFPATSADQARAELAAIRPLICANGAKYFGRAEPAAWSTSQRLLARAGNLPTGVDPTEYYTYRYLPPESALRPCPVTEGERG
jgi:NitT/TauT family transport system substrate-binding protein